MNPQLIQQVDEFVAKHRQSILDDICELSRIPSVRSESKPGMPYGEKCREVLDVGVALARRHGFDAQVYGDKYALAISGEGDRTVGLFGHLDVVPVGEGWTVTQPFDPVEKDGVLYGRGVNDNKAGVVLSLYTAKALRDLGVPLNSKLLLFMGSNEESGMDDVKTFVAEHPMPDFSLVPDAGFPVCHGEKGSCRCWVLADRPFVQIRNMEGGAATNVVCDEVRATLTKDAGLAAELQALCQGHPWVSCEVGEDEIVLVAKGRSSHASTPQSSHNATYEMCKLLGGCQSLAATDRETCAFAAKTLDGYYGEAIGIAHEDEASGKLTCANGIVKIKEGRLTYSYDVRYCVTLDGSVVEGNFRKFFSPGCGFSIDDLYWGNGYFVPRTDERIQTLLGIYRDITGDAAAEPYTMGGGTYARNLKNAVAFGPSPRGERPDLGLPVGHGGAHQPDETLLIDPFLQGLKVYILAVAELCRP